MTSINKSTWASWLLAIATVAHLTFVWCNRDPAMINADSAQLVTAARNMLEGKGFSTSALYYEEQHALAPPPVPLTVWPPGFAVGMLPFVAAGISGFDAAFALAAIGMVLSVSLTYRLALAAGLHVSNAFLACLGTVLLAQFGILVVNAVSEPIFIATTLASGLLFVQSETFPNPRNRLWMAGALAGLAMLFRYSGIAWIASVLISIVLIHWRDGPKVLISRLTAFGAIPVAIATGLLARNLALVGSLTGGPTMGGDTSVRLVLQEFYWTALRLFGAFDNYGEPIAAFVFALVTIFGAIFAVQVVLRRPDKRTGSDAAQPVDRLVVVAVGYGMITAIMLGYVSFKTYAGLAQERYLAPLVPFALILGAALFQRAEKLTARTSRTARQVSRLLLFLIIIGYALGQSHVAAREWKVRKTHPQIAESHDVWTESIDGEPVGTYLKRHVSFRQPLLTADGQMLAALLDIPVIGLPEKRYSRKIWNETEVRNLMQATGSCLLFVQPDWLTPLKRDPGFFLVRLAEGAQPDWLVPIHHTGRLQIHRATWCEATEAALGSP